MPVSIFNPVYADIVGKNRVVAIVGNPKHDLVFPLVVQIFKPARSLRFSRTARPKPKQNKQAKPDNRGYK